MTAITETPSRRSFIRQLVKTLLWTAAWPYARTAAALGDLPPGYAGVVAFQGQVSINGQPAAKGQPVNPGDGVATGSGASLVFVMGKDAFLLREHTRLEIGAGTIAELTVKAGQAMRLMAGKVLTVWGSGSRRFETPTAVVAVRGTGIYFEAEPERTYICTCYGQTDIVATGAPAVRERVTTRHHESPRFVYAGKIDGMIAPAPVMNHTDAELTHLESLVGRIPPFIKGASY
jgi:hypothetical protein